MIKTAATAIEPARDNSAAPVQPLYLEALTLVERLHRRLLDVINDEFDRRGRADIYSVQALLLYNIGDNDPVGLMEMISTLEAALGVEATKIFLPMQPGDVPATFANIDKLRALCGYKPKVKLADGLARFVAWRRAYAG